MDDDIIELLLGMQIVGVAFDSDDEVLCLIGEDARRVYITAEDGCVSIFGEEHSLQ